MTMNLVEFTMNETVLFLTLNANNAQSPTTALTRTGSKMPSWERPLSVALPSAQGFPLQLLWCEYMAQKSPGNISGPLAYTCVSWSRYAFSMNLRTQSETEMAEPM